MKQIIPFQKELLFKTKVSEITSISLEHSIYTCNSDVLTGSFLVSGDYKMTEGSINKEKFDFDIPFEISLNNKYDEKTVKIDIDNFYYELINSEILKVNIDVYVVGEEVNTNDINDTNNVIDEDRVEVTSSESNVKEEVKVEDKIESNVKEEVKVEDKIESNVNINNSIFNNIDSGETYITYFVYVVKEGDTLDSILNKFNVTKDELEKYNDLSLFKEKTKLVIPSNNE
ncbi:MAG: LysM peptidoglycan-binding domain-containing protein [Bacilli bacterium]|nr:LysM peptidoglycan-binding domain-containing protein [Bacilli bacterium]